MPKIAVWCDSIWRNWPLPWPLIADHGAYPAKLADLSPKYVAAIPKDRFTDGDLHYSLQDGGYLLYSVGHNGQDDGGKGVEDRKEGREPWDDRRANFEAVGWDPFRHSDFQFGICFGVRV